MRCDIAVRGHDLAHNNDLDGLGQALHQRGLHSLAYSPTKSLPKLTASGEKVNIGLGNYVRRILTTYNVEIATLSCYVNMIDPNQEHQSAMIARLEKYLQVAPAFGTRIVATETGSVNPTFAFTKENFTRGLFDTLVHNTKRILRIARCSGTFLALEPGVNHPLYSLNRVAELLTAVDYDPNLKLIIDPANLVLSPNDRTTDILTEALARFSERIVAVHLKDYRWTDNESQLIQVVTPGDGQSDVKKMLEIADQAQPYGIKCLDELPDGKLDQVLSIPWLANL